MKLTVIQNRQSEKYYASATAEDGTVYLSDPLHRSELWLETYECEAVELTCYNPRHWVVVREVRA